MGAISYLNNRASGGSIIRNAAIGDAPHGNMAIDVVISGAPYGSTAIDAAIDCAPYGSMPVDAAIGGAPHGSMPICIAIGCAHRGSGPICIANGCDHRRISPVFNKVELRYGFLAAAELAEGAVTARFFLVGLYEGNARVKEFVKHMAHGDLEVG